MDKESINRILRIAEEKKYSNRKLADKAGISHTTMNRYLNMDNDIPADKLYDIADALGVSVEYIRFGYEPKPKNKLLDISEQLNEDGNKKLIEYAEDLLENVKYRRWCEWIETTKKRDSRHIKEVK